MEDEIRLREAALEAQRQRELFVKQPKRSYSNLGHTQSGLLSQLLKYSTRVRTCFLQDIHTIGSCLRKT